MYISPIYEITNIFLFPYLDYQEKKNFVNKLSLIVWNYMAAKHLFSENSVLLEKKKIINILKAYQFLIINNT